MKTPSKSRRPRTAAGLLPLLVLFLFFPSCSNHRGIESFPEGARRASERVVKILACFKGREKFWGSGVLISGGNVFTASHVIEGADQIFLEMSDGGRLPVREVRLNSANLDIAVLRVDEKDLPEKYALDAVLLAKSWPEQKPAYCYAVGKKSGAFKAKVIYASPRAPLFAIDGANPGDSGGPVFMADGTLVGLILMKSDLGYALSLPYVMNNLEEGDLAYPSAAPAFEEAFLWGIMAVSRQRWTEAKTLLETARDGGRGDLETSFYLGLSYINCGEPEKAISCLREVVCRSPKSFEAWHNLGLASRSAGQNTDAISAFENALALKPDDSQILFSLATTYFETGNLEEAAQNYSKAIAFEPENGLFYYGLASVEIQRGNYTKAKRALRQAKRYGMDVGDLENVLAEREKSGGN